MQGATLPNRRPRLRWMGLLGLALMGTSWAEEPREIKLPAGVVYALKELERPESQTLGVNQLLTGSSNSAASALPRKLETTGVTGTNEAEALYLSRMSGVFGTLRVGFLGKLRQDANASALKGSRAAQCRLRHEKTHQLFKQRGATATARQYDQHIAESLARLQATEDLMEAACESRHIIIFGINRQNRLAEKALADFADAPKFDPYPVNIAYRVLLELARTGYWAAQEDICQMLPWHGALEKVLADNEEPTSTFCALAAQQGSAWAQFEMITKHLASEPLVIPAPSELRGPPPLRLKLLERAVENRYVPAMDYYIVEAARQKTGDSDVIQEAAWAGSPLGARLRGDMEYQLMNDAIAKNFGEKNVQRYRDGAINYYLNAQAWGSTWAEKQLHSMGELTNAEKLKKAQQAPQELQAKLVLQCTEKHAEPRAVLGQMLINQNDTLERAMRFSVNRFHCGPLLDEIYPAYEKFKLRKENSWGKYDLQWCQDLASLEMARWQWEEFLRKEGCY